MEQVRQPVMRGERLILRELVPDDTPALFRLMSDPAVMRYWSRTPFTEAREAAELIEAIRLDTAAGALWEWALESKEGDGLIGTCTLHHLNPRHRRAEIGCALTPGQWGRGLMREAMALVITHAFADPGDGGLGLERLEADTDPRNGAALSLLKRLGFRAEGLLRRRWCVAGAWSDSAIFGLLREEWAEAGATDLHPGLPPGKGRE
jgi:RimJ/RimL family protein N-acetyltransferase